MCLTLLQYSLYCGGLEPNPQYLWGAPAHESFLLFKSFRYRRCCCCLVAQSCPTLYDPMDCSPPGSSVHGISQARILEWVTISFSRESSRPRDQTWVSCIAGRFFTDWATREAHFITTTTVNFLVAMALKIQLEPSKFPPCVVSCLTESMPCSPMWGAGMVQGMPGPPSPGRTICCGLLVQAQVTGLCRSQMQVEGW